VTYSNFTTISKVRGLGIDVVEAGFLPEILSIAPSEYSGSRMNEVHQILTAQALQMRCRTSL
jgi:predicted component of type VI protein secretion system